MPNDIISLLPFYLESQMISQCQVKGLECDSRYPEGWVQLVPRNQISEHISKNDQQWKSKIRNLKAQGSIAILQVNKRHKIIKPG